MGEKSPIDVLREADPRHISRMPTYIQKAIRELLELDAAKFTGRGSSYRKHRRLEHDGSTKRMNMTLLMLGHDGSYDSAT